MASYNNDVYKKNLQTAYQKIYDFKKEFTLSAEEKQAMSIQWNFSIVSGRSKNLLKMTLVYIFSLFEGFLKDFLIEIYSNFPNTMKSKKTIEYEKLLEFNTMDELYYALAIDIVNQMTTNIDKIEKNLDKKFNIKLKEFRYWKELRENFYHRNIVVHNAGRVNKSYKNKIKECTMKDGEELIMNFNYVKNCYRNVRTAIGFLQGAFIDKFKMQSEIVNETK